MEINLGLFSWSCRINKYCVDKMLNSVVLNLVLYIFTTGLWNVNNIPPSAYNQKGDWNQYILNTKKRLNLIRPEGFDNGSSFPGVVLHRKYFLSSTKLQHIGHFTGFEARPYLILQKEKLCSYTESLIQSYSSSCETFSENVDLSSLWNVVHVSVPHNGRRNAEVARLFLHVTDVVTSVGRSRTDMSYVGKLDA